MPPSLRGLREKRGQENYYDFVKCMSVQNVKIKQFSESAFQHSDHLLSRAASVALSFCSARKGAAVKCLGQIVHLAQRCRPLPPLMSADRAPARPCFSSICTKKESPAMPDLPFFFFRISPGRKEKTRRGGRGCLGSAPARFFCPYSSASIRLTM